MSVHPLAHPYSAEGRPEETGGRRIGILLSHGFTGSPVSMRPWGEAMAEFGYAVEVPRLPGHGTTWQELNGTTWADWSGHLDRVLADLADRCDAVVVGGLSMGGGLALSLAARHPEVVRGVLLVNPAVASSNKQLLAAPLLQHVVGSVAAIGNDIKKPGVEEHAYPRTPLRALVSMTKGWKQVRGELGSVEAPVLMFRSAEDHVVDPSSGVWIRDHVRHVTERILTESYHVATIDNDADRIVEDSLDFVARVTA
ncbi:MAG TPA: alpha/beta fold hydrolase [Nocardioides sp.]